MVKREDNAPVIDQKQRERIIKRTSWIGILGNTILSGLKITIGVISGSFALIGDGLDSLTDVLTSSITLFTGAISSKPPDLEHPYGHARAETIATKLLSFIIFFAGAELGITAVKQLIAHELRETPSPIAFIAIGISIVGKILLALNKFRAGERVNSSMLIADAKNMKNDVYISLSVLVGVFFTIILKMPILDSITTIVVSLWILKSAFEIFSEASSELMDGLDRPDLYDKVFRTTRMVPGVINPHKTRIRKLNNVYIIDMDIEVDGSLTVAQGHEIAINIETALRVAIPEIFDVTIHIEPEGNIEAYENFGVTEDLLMKE